MGGRGGVWHKLREWLIGVPDPNVVVQREGGESRRFFFPNAQASTYQLHALNGCENLQRRLMENVFNWRPTTSSPPQQFLAGDLLIVGPPASGKTNTLIASMVFSAWIMGQETLAIAGDKERALGMYERLRGVMGRLQLDGHIQVKFLDQHTLAEWWKGVSPLPHILVGTWQEVKELSRDPLQIREGCSDQHGRPAWPVVGVDDYFDQPNRASLLAFRKDQAERLTQRFRISQFLFAFETADAENPQAVWEDETGKLGFRPLQVVAKLYKP